MPTYDWPKSETVPALVLRDGTTLPPDELAALIHLLRHDLPEPVRATMQDLHPAQPWRRAAIPNELRSAFDALRARCTEQALDVWMSKLLRAWLEDIGTGTARKIRWVIPAAAHLGGDACAALIGPHLRGQNFELRCTGEVAVEALLDMGTRGALLELAHLARKYPTKTRGQAAIGAMNDLAAAQGITPEQLRDRFLPDGGLDASGRRTFDYGPRQFEVLLDDRLMPVLRAPNGRCATTLPKPTTKDDAKLAADARAAWKIAKTQIQQTTRALAARFETAMIAGTTWPAAEFNEYFRRHPLARHVVRRLLWTSAAPDEPVAACFRIAEDDTLADANDAPIELADGGVRVRPVHPLQLDPTTRETWQRLFAEYQIVGPFPQLDRPVYTVRADQATLTTLTSLPHARVDAKALVFPLETRGWARQDYADNGMLTRHIRRFPGSGVAACLEYDPGAFLGDLPGSGVQTLTQLYFTAPNAHVHSSQALPLCKVPPIVFSETLRDINALVPAA